MAVPTTRSEFKEHCLRRLGKPVIEINVDDDQVEDRIDQALKYYQDYHFDGSEVIYLKHKVTGGEDPGAANSVTITDAGNNYVNGDTFSIASTVGAGATGAVVTDANGGVTDITFNLRGDHYETGDIITISSNTGSGAVVSLIAGDGSLAIGDPNVIGITRVFPLGGPSLRSSDLFNVRYQIALNELYNLVSVSLTPYYMARMHLQLIEEILIGKQPIRWNRHTNRIYVDTDWSKMNSGDYLLFEGYRKLDETVYSDIWSDRWLQQYTTALIKLQWGSNLTKFSGMQLVAGVQFNGDRILTDAQNEISTLEHEMINSYSLPVSDMIG